VRPCSLLIWDPRPAQVPPARAPHSFRFPGFLSFLLLNVRLVLVMLRGSSGDKIMLACACVGFLSFLSSWLVSLWFSGICLFVWFHINIFSRDPGSGLEKTSVGGRGDYEVEGTWTQAPGTSHEKLPLAPRNMTTRTNH